MGWPREFKRRVFISHIGGVACAVGRGLGRRAHKTRRLLLRGLATAAAEGRRLPEFRALSVGIHDGHCNEVMLAYATFMPTSAAKNLPPCKAFLIPSFQFFDGIPGKNATAALEPARAARSVCGWAGRSNSDVGRDSLNPAGMHSPIRPRFVVRARNRTDLFDIWDTARPGTPSLRLDEQVRRWACLIDIRGAGYSGRVPSLLHTGRPLLYVERPGLMTYFEAPSFIEPLSPWTHFVPVSPSLDDLVERADWLLRGEGSSTARQMAERARRYARCYLTTEFAERFAVEQLVAAAVRYRLNPDAAPDPSFAEYYPEGVSTQIKKTLAAQHKLNQDSHSTF